jgi:hypothetical protein
MTDDDQRDRDAVDMVLLEGGGIARVRVRDQQVHNIPVYDTPGSPAPQRTLTVTSTEARDFAALLAAAAHRADHPDDPEDRKDRKESLYDRVMSAAAADDADALDDAPVELADISSNDIRGLVGELAAEAAHFRGAFHELEDELEDLEDEVEGAVQRLGIAAEFSAARDDAAARIEYFARFAAEKPDRPDPPRQKPPWQNRTRTMKCEALHPDSTSRLWPVRCCRPVGHDGDHFGYGIAITAPMSWPAEAKEADTADPDTRR